jgi:hypothetical protein
MAAPRGAREIGHGAQEADRLRGRDEVLQARERDRARRRQPGPGAGKHLRRNGDPELQPQLLRHHPLRFLRIADDPVGQLAMRGDEAADRFPVPGEEGRARHQERGDRLRLLDQHAAAGLQFEPRHPGLDRPDGVELPRSEERELIGVRRRHDLGVAAGLGDPQPAGGEPGAGGHVLSVAELRRRDAPAAEVGRLAEVGVPLHDQRRAAGHRPGDHPDLVSARAREGVNRRIGPDIGQIETAGEDRLHRARTGVVGEPLDVDALWHAGLEPVASLSFEVARHQRLGVRDVGKVADADHLLRHRCRRQA